MMALEIGRLWIPVGGEELLASRLRALSHRDDRRLPSTNILNYLSVDTGVIIEVEQS